jgi:hypothetical protein
MTPLETGLGLATAALLAALLAGAGVYVKVGRKLLTKEEHEKECERNTLPFDRDIKVLHKDVEDIKGTCRRMEDKQEDSTRDLREKLDKIFLELLRVNGKKP